MQPRLPAYVLPQDSVFLLKLPSVPDAEGRRRLARYMIRCPFSLEKMRYDHGSGMVVYRCKLHTTLKRNYQLIQNVYAVDPLECTRCGATLRIIALIDNGGVIERSPPNQSQFALSTLSLPQGIDRISYR